MRTCGPVERKEFPGCILNVPCSIAKVDKIPFLVILVVGLAVIQSVKKSLALLALKEELTS